ncbi:putative Ig domain-containing protein [Dietzia sp. 179-F 9C3 NHS]|uniref:putative Ig domain-containing protein n=1 Tax=Dietzia sp. 179-F 9C3 NHS TaxID=3374295 RepID=UPI0038798417
MFQRRSPRTAPRARSMVAGAAVAAAAVMGGGVVVAVTAPGAVVADDLRLAQNAQGDAAPEMRVGTPVVLDLEPVVAGAAGGAVPDGTTVTVTGLPDGLTQDGWIISGTPTRAGTYDLLVTVTSGQETRSEAVSVTVAEAAGGGSPAADRVGAAADGEGVGDGASGAGDGASGADGGATGDGETLPGEDGTAPGVTTPDLCAAFGGEGAADGSSLAAGLLPLLGEEGESVPVGLLTVVADALVRMLPAVLGDTGSLSRAVCTLQPVLSGSGEAAQGDATADGAGGAGAEGAAGAATTGGATTGAGAESAPTALLGLLGTAGGSLGE